MSYPDLNTLSERVQFVRKQRGLTQVQLNDMLVANGEPAPKGTVGMLEKRTETSRSKYAHGLAEALGVNYQWLTTGEGESGLELPQNKTKEEKMARLEQLYRERQTQKTSPLNLPMQAVLDTLCPVVDSVAAGSWSANESKSADDVKEWIARPHHLSKQAYVLIVDGYSMYPAFNPGDYIYVEPNVSAHQLKNEALVVVQNEHYEATFKQIIIPNNDLSQAYLKPLNPEWREQEMSLENCQLLGVVDGKYVRYEWRDDATV